MKILVTGDRGYIGSATRSALSLAGHVVVGLDRARQRGEDIRAMRPDHLCEMVSESDAVVHLAAHADISANWSVGDAGFRSRYYLYKDNIQSTYRLLEAMALAGKPTACMVFASTGAVYGHGGYAHECDTLSATSPYSASKIAGESMVEAYATGVGFREVRLRFASVVGDGYRHGHIADFVRMASTPEGVTAKDDGSQRKTFVSLAEAVGAIVHAVEDRNVRGAYNIGGELWSIRDTLAEMLETRRFPVSYASSKKGWIGDPVDLDMNTERAIEDGFRIGARGSVRDGVREALKSLGWGR